MEVLALFASHCDALTVSSLVLSKEVRGLSNSDYESMGIDVLVPTWGQLEGASNFKGISAIDGSNLVLCRDHSLILVTSDGALRTKAAELGIQTIRNLRIMLLLVEQQLLRPTKAHRIVTIMAQIDPFFITASIVEDFSSELQLASEIASLRSQ